MSGQADRTLPWKLAGIVGAMFAFGFALVPPLLFYSYQFYAELPGALVLAVAFRALALQPERLSSHPWRFGWLVAALPWLHQKFLPVWAVLVATALLVGWRRRTGAGGAADAGAGPALRRLATGVLVPTLVSAYLFALYNFAITGSVRPDALFLAWGPGGVTSARVGQGLLGLLLDARFGILPYVPVLLLAGAGLATGGARRFAVVLPAAVAYYLTVASADNWSGAVCNLGRYVMPVAPLAVALFGIAVARTAQRKGALALVLTLGSWTALLALALREDPHAANDSALLLAKSTYADGLQYVPGLFIRTWADAAPGLWLRILAWLLLIAAAALWLRRVASARAGNVMGGGDWAADRLVPDCLRAFAAGKPVRLRHPGAVRPWQHVLDPLAGYLALATGLLRDDGARFATAWNFGPDAGDDASVGEVAARLAGLWGADARLEHEAEPGPPEVELLRLDSTRARTELGWEPRWSLDAALGQTLAWHRAWDRGENMHAFTRAQIANYDEGAVS